MNWRDYEKEILEIFINEYPNAQIKHNAHIEGRYSKVNRQIDVLIEDYVAGSRIRIVVDGKCFNSKIDVKDVEMFIGMLNDIDAHKGLLITQQGYSEAAIKRAYNDPTDLELDILNFKDLHEFQGFVGLPYAGENMAVMPAPFGWIIDASRRKGMIASLYQRGLTFEEAFKKNEWAYVNFWKKEPQTSTLDDLLILQEKETLHEFPSAKISYLDTVIRKEFKTKLRRIDYDTYPVPEYTGFIEFDDYFFFCVMFTREELTKKNIRKLESILLNTQQGKIERGDNLNGEINKLESLLLNAENNSDKSDILVAQGEVYLKFKKYEDAIIMFDNSISLINTCYGAIKGKLKVMVALKKKPNEFQDLIDKFFMLGPENPTVCLDILEIYSEVDDLESATDIFLKKAGEYEKSSEAYGNINYHLGHAYESLGNFEFAKKYLLEAKESFKKSLPSDHIVHGNIDIILKRLNSE